VLPGQGYLTPQGAVSGGMMMMIMMMKGRKLKTLGRESYSSDPSIITNLTGSHQGLNVKLQGGKICWCQRLQTCLSLKAVMIMLKVFTIS
jgi:hypothetical protein